MSKPKVAIIGAGPSGLSQLCAFAAAGDVADVVCFEKQNDWGGLWNYTWRTGLDQYGEPVHCSMYRYLWSNGPKECLEFPDYSFEEHFGAPIASYPPRAVLADYLRGRAEKYKVRRHIRFNTVVREVDYLSEREQFRVRVRDLAADTADEHYFDYVIVASGHFSTPNTPQFDGFAAFNGRILHAHDFRDAREFTGQRMLLIGTSYSAEDIGSQCHKYGAKSITCSHRTAPMGFHWPDNWREVPLLTSVAGNTATFKDNTTVDVDSIILCTGYLHHFPFMADALRLQTTNRLWIENLYQGVLWRDNPKLMYLGMQDQFYTFTMFDAQAWYARDVILGKIKPPTPAAMQKHGAEWLAREEKLADDEQMIWFQGDNVRELIAATDYPDYDTEGVNKTFMEWEHHKHDDIMGFRNNTYRSLVTGTMQKIHHTKWLDAMDDSMESYLRDR